jgi:hypothetical protein
LELEIRPRAVWFVIRQSSARRSHSYWDGVIMFQRGGSIGE